MSLPPEWELRHGPGGLGVRWKGKTLTSAYRPDEDAARRALGLPNAELYLVMGWGSGHFLRALAERNQAVVLAWEPHLGRVRASRAYPGWMENHPRIIFWQDGELPYETLRAFNPFEIKIVVHPGLEEEPEIIRSKKQADNLLDRLAVNDRTLQRFAGLWGRNTAANLHLARAESLDPWHRWAEGRTAVIAAAGPSLEKSLDWLAHQKIQNAGRFLLIAVDTASEALSARGITPDFLVSMDAQYWNSRHLDTALPEQTVLVSELVGAPSVLRRHKGRVILAGSSIPLVQDVEQGLLPRLASGGSVSTAAASLAGYLGCGQIVWLGLDLCYTRFRTHARPGLVHRLRERWACRTQSLATLSAEASFNQTMVRARRDRKELIADQRMPLYAAWLSDARREGLLPGGYRVGFGWPVEGYSEISRAEEIQLSLSEPLPAFPEPCFLSLRNTGNWERGQTAREWLDPAKDRLGRWPGAAAEQEYQRRLSIVAAFFQQKGDHDDHT